MYIILYLERRRDLTVQSQSPTCCKSLCCYGLAMMTSARPSPSYSATGGATCTGSRA